MILLLDNSTTKLTKKVDFTNATERHFFDFYFAAIVLITLLSFVGNAIVWPAFLWIVALQGLF